MDGPPPVGPLGPMPAALWLRLSPAGGCWIWTGAVASKGRYGVINYQGKRWMVHRLTYHTMFRALRPGEEIHHRKPVCLTGLCCRPTHLMPMDEDAHRALHARGLPSWDSEMEIAAEVAARMVREALAHPA